MRTACLCIALLLVAPSGLAADPAPPRHEPSAPDEDRTHLRLAPAVPQAEQSVSGREEFPAFGVELPRGWRKVGLEPARADGASMAVRFEGPRGLYLHVEVDPAGHGVSADAAWTCEIGTGGGLSVAEEPRCTLPAGVEPEEEGCAVGDGRLDVFMLCNWTVAGAQGSDRIARSAVFMFGSTVAEDGVEMDVFRRILATVRVRR